MRSLRDIKKALQDKIARSVSRQQTESAVSYEDATVVTEFEIDRKVLPHRLEVTYDVLYPEQTGEASKYQDRKAYDDIVRRAITDVVAELAKEEVYGPYSYCKDHLASLHKRYNTLLGEKLPTPNPNISTTCVGREDACLCPTHVQSAQSIGEFGLTVVTERHGPMGMQCYSKLFFRTSDDSTSTPMEPKFTPNQLDTLDDFVRTLNEKVQTTVLETASGWSERKVHTGKGFRATCDNAIRHMTDANYRELLHIMRHPNGKTGSRAEEWPPFTCDSYNYKPIHLGWDRDKASGLRMPEGGSRREASGSIARRWAQGTGDFEEPLQVDHGSLYDERRSLSSGWSGSSLESWDTQ
jgi:hypothetical protein